MADMINLQLKMRKVKEQEAALERMKKIGKQFGYRGNGGEDKGEKAEVIIVSRKDKRFEQVVS